MEHQSNRYDDFALRYAELVAAREEAGIEHDPIMPRFLKLLGDVSGLLTLDAGCGEGYVSRILARHGAQVTGLDSAASLIEIARAKDPEGSIVYQVADLSQPLRPDCQPSGPQRCVRLSGVPHHVRSGC